MERNHDISLHFHILWLFLIQAFHFFEVLVCFYCQFVGSFFVAYNNTFWMELQTGNRTHVADCYLYGFTERTCRVVTMGNNQDLLGRYRRLNPNRDRLLGHFVDVIIKEA